MNRPIPSICVVGRQDGALLRSFIRALREAGLHPVGVANATASDMQVRLKKNGRFRNVVSAY